MTHVQEFQIEDIEGCEFVSSPLIGYMLISWDRDEYGSGNGKIRVVYPDGSGGAITQDEAQSRLDSGEWKVYRP